MNGTNLENFDALPTMDGSALHQLDEVHGSTGLRYSVYGIDWNGARHEVKRTRSARVARYFRDSGNSPWPKTEVHGTEGELSIDELNHLADLDHRYA